MPPQMVMDALRKKIMREKVAALRKMADDLTHLAVYSGVIDHVNRAADQLEREVTTLG